MIISSTIIIIIIVMVAILCFIYWDSNPIVSYVYVF